MPTKVLNSQYLSQTGIVRAKPEKCKDVYYAAIAVRNLKSKKYIPKRFTNIFKFNIKKMYDLYCFHICLLNCQVLIGE